MPIPTFQRRDLFERIERGDYPEWELGPQLFDEAFADSQPYDVLDATKIIPEEVLPVRIVGKLVLDRYPDDHLAEPEQAAFVPSHVVPGIGFSNVPLLQGRLFSYTDTQLSRRVADGLAMELPPAPPAAAPVLDMEPSPALRIIRGPLEKHRLEGRTVGILIADGSDAAAVATLTDVVANAKGHALLIAPKVGKVPLSDGSAVAADKQLFGQSSVTIDACAVILSAEATAKLCKEGAAVQWVMDAFGHLKAIGQNAEAKPAGRGGRRTGRRRDRPRGFRGSRKEALLGPRTRRAYACLMNGVAGCPPAGGQRQRSPGRLGPSPSEIMVLIAG